ncbi:hypothetical protein L1887_09714 [Cichorium endivia]|nr:hypothetical protein L1887_09714 [Cichorium endivia]
MVTFRFASFELSSNQKVRLRKEDVDDKPWWHSDLPSVAVLRKARKRKVEMKTRGVSSLLPLVKGRMEIEG